MRPSSRGDGIDRDDLVRMAVPLLIVVIMLFVGLQVLNVAAGPTADIDREIAESRAYCYQAHGDPSLGNSMVIGNHGGLHCLANDDEPHLHDVTERAKMAAYLANESNRTVDQWPEDRYEPRHKREGMPDILSGVSLLLIGGVFIAALRYAPGRVK